MPAPLRIAIVGTPRSGNTWLRRLLQAAYGIPEVAVHELADGDWDRLPPEVALQLHCPPTPAFEERLRRHGFRPLVLARHPLDVLVSVMHFAWYDPNTGRWLDGAGGNEDGLRAAMPRSRSFVEYCTGPRADALLRVTADWWDRPGVIALRYEDMVADPLAGLYRLAEWAGPPRCPDVTAAVAACSLDALRRGCQNNHFWKGKPGLWRELLPAAEANEILAAVRPACERLGYDTTPDDTLTPAAADANWVAAAGGELADTVRRNLEGFYADLHRLTAERDTAATERAAAVAERDAARAELAELVQALTAARRPDEPPPAMTKHLGDTADRIEGLFRLHRFPLRVAEFVQGVKNRVSGKYKNTNASSPPRAREGT